MGSKVLLPSLSEDGWVNNSIKVADYLLSHFFESDRSQTAFYLNKVSSLAWIIQHNQGDVKATASELQTTLEVYFTRYFDNVIVEVSEVSDEIDPSNGQVTIYLKFTDTEGKDYVLARLIKLIDSKIQSIITINNGF